MLKGKTTSLLKNLSLMGDPSSWLFFSPFIILRRFTCNELFKQESKCLLFLACPFFQILLFRVHQLLCRILVFEAQEFRHIRIFQRVPAYGKRWTYKQALPCSVMAAVPGRQECCCHLSVSMAISNISLSVCFLNTES